MSIFSKMEFIHKMTDIEKQVAESKVLAEKIIAICDDIKAVDIQLYDVSKYSSVADFYIICTGNSDPHLKAIADKVQTDMRHADQPAAKTDGTGPYSQWVVLDFHGIIVHIMHPETRAHYNLEDFWSKGMSNPETLPWECKEHEILTSEDDYRRQQF